MQFPYGGDEQVEQYFDWTGIYHCLLREGRIWDLRDLVVALTAAALPGLVREKFFATGPDSTENELARILADWSSGTFDEATSLAILEIAASFCLNPPLNSTNFSCAEQVIKESQSIASEVAARDCQLLIARLYLRWCLAKIMVATFADLHDKELGFPGLLLYQNDLASLPHYIPLVAEHVPWELVDLPSHANSEIQTILDTANELGDYETECICRKMLVRRSPEPSIQLDNLLTLQRTVQKDMNGYTHSLLTKYFISDNDTSRARLRNELEEQGEKDCFGTLLCWTRLNTLRALSKGIARDDWLRRVGGEGWDRLPRIAREWFYKMELDTIRFLSEYRERWTDISDQDVVAPVLEQFNYPYSEKVMIHHPMMRLASVFLD